MAGKSETIVSQRLRLEPFSENHLTERIAAWLNDPETTCYSEQRHRKHTLETCRAYYRAMQDTPHYYWAIIARDDRLGHIGNITAYVDSNNRVADLAIMIGEPVARGRGLGAEAWQAACRFLLSNGDMRKVTAGTMANNKAMLAVMCRSGMTIEGRRKGQFLHQGQEVDMVHAALFRDPADGD